MHRRHFLGLMTGAALAVVGTAALAELPKLAKKDKYKVGFAQTESNNP
jgi:galactofuranose transport system substrate-binding protein